MKIISIKTDRARKREILTPEIHISDPDQFRLDFARYMRKSRKDYKLTIILEYEEGR